MLLFKNKERCDCMFYSSISLFSCFTWLCVKLYLLYKRLRYSCLEVLCYVKKCLPGRIRKSSGALPRLLRQSMLSLLRIVVAFVFKEVSMVKFSLKDVISNANFWRFLCDTIIAFGKLLTFIIDGQFDDKEE